MSAAGRLVAIAVLSVVAVGIALVSQHVFDMQPCPWCVLQRAIFVAIALISLIGLVLRSGAARAGAATLALLLAIAGGAAAIWQHFWAAASPSCNLTLADKILNGAGLTTLAPDVFAPRATCADAAVSLFGVPYDFWSLGLFVIVAILAIAALAAAPRRPAPRL
jgi:disulfide bond formation protein DsbB